MKKKSIDVCFSPALFHLYDASESIVVVIDVLRATSSICIAFEHGVRSIVPVSKVEESSAYRAKGYLVGAERKGEMVEGFDLGNSPFSYMDPKVKDRDIALTTTNGTQAIAIARNAFQIAIGSFLNQDALCNWLKQQNRNVILLCSGWKNSFNFEDTLFAGAVVHKLLDNFELTDHRDSALAAMQLYDLAKDDLYGFLEQSSHRKRLEKLQIEDDIVFCLTPNQTDCIPVMVGDAIYNLNVLQSM
ncbi:MAG: 2-phosphosulfolactate phosphatase [Bacteroidia bacterium]|nr:2-phosphosulfolactate phosphatase [Bacteroidota bacterium]MBP9084084.1 2-phosphosulfolactate phosphatase [Bacteroidia bacterium]